MANITYHQIIRKITVGFGNLFDNITLVRYNPDDTESERFIVPIAYAAKELYVQRLQSDYNLDKKNLIIDEVYADEGPRLKRIRPRAQGRAYARWKPTCHITVVVKSIN